MQSLYDYIFQRGTIVPISTFDERVLSVGDVSKQVIESINKALIIEFVN